MEEKGKESKMEDDSHLMDAYERNNGLRHEAIGALGA